MGGNWPVLAGIWQECAHSAGPSCKPVGARLALCQSQPRVGALRNATQAQHPNCSPFLDRSAPSWGRPAPFPLIAADCAGLCPYPTLDIVYPRLAGDCLTKSNTQKGSLQCIENSSLSPSRRFSALQAVSTPISSAALPVPRQARCLPMPSAATPSPARSSAARLARPATISAPKPANNLIRPSGRKTHPDRHGRLRAPVAVSHLKDLA
jgi:hypothetical protein